MKDDVPRHYNLYYLFKEDKEAHPMPLARAEAVRKRILELFEKT